MVFLNRRASGHNLISQNALSDVKFTRSKTVNQMADVDLLNMDFKHNQAQMEQKYNYLDKVDETLEESLLGRQSELWNQNMGSGRKLNQGGDKAKSHQVIHTQFQGKARHDFDIFI